jgi:hypothetical protein
MKTTISTEGDFSVLASIEDGRWSCADRATRRFLQGESSARPAVAGSVPDADYAEAQRLAALYGYAIIGYVGPDGVEVGAVY